MNRSASPLLRGLALAFVGLGSLAQAGDVVYVESNIATANGNGILAFRRDAEGGLTMLPGSPFLTGGAGVSPSFSLGPYDSDQEIVVSPDGSTLYAVNGGSDTIAVMKIKSDGSLASIPGSPFASGGTTPCSLGLSGHCLVVVNSAENPGVMNPDSPNYTVMQILGSGALKPVKGSTLYADLGSSPSQALIGPSNGLVFGDEFLGGTVRSLKLTPQGRLIPLDAVPAPPSLFVNSAAPPLPLGMAAHPKKPYLYVGLVTINTLAVYNYKPNGQLNYVASAPSSGKGMCWVVVNKAGTRLYTSNTGDSSISVYSLANPAAPVEIQKVSLAGPGEAYQIHLDGQEKFFYALTQKNKATEPDASNALHVLTVDGNGMLAEVATSPTVLSVPEGTRPQGVVAP